MDKQSKKESKAKLKIFLVEIECLVPTTLRYRIAAKDAEKAIEEVKLGKVDQLERPIYHISKIKKNKYRVIEWLTSKLVLIR